MTLSTEKSSKVYNGNGVTDTFTFPFKFFETSHLRVTVDGVVKTEGVHYNVTGAGAELGGDVIFTVGNIPPVGVNNVEIERILPLTQDADPQNFDGNPADSTEAVYDTITMLVQQVNDLVLRTPKFPAGSTTVSSIEEPVDGNFILWDGVNLVNGGDASEITNAQGYAVAAAGSAAAALVSETNAGVSEANSAASAAAAAAALESAPYRDTKTITFADSPYSLTDSDRSFFISVDTSGGAVIINLDLIANVALPFNARIKKETADANAILINSTGTDEFTDGSTQKTVSSVGGIDIVAEDDTAPDQWKTGSFGAAAGDVTVDVFEDGVDYTSGTTTTLTASAEAGSENNAVLTFDGVTQHHDQWSLAGTLLTPNGGAPIPLGVKDIEFRYGTSLSVGTPADTSVTFNKMAASAIASQAEAEAGVVSNKLMTPERTKQAIDALAPAPVFTESYTSAQQAVVSGGSITLAHGLSSLPKLFAAHLVCLTAEGGYSIGDIIPCAIGENTDGSPSRGVNIVDVDGTDIFIQYSDSASVFAQKDGGSGAFRTQTNANFELVIHAWA